MTNVDKETLQHLKQYVQTQKQILEDNLKTISETGGTYLMNSGKLEAFRQVLNVIEFLDGDIQNEH